MHTLRPGAVAALVLVVVAAACAGGPAPGAVTPADIPALEAQRAQTPNDAATNFRLARAYYAAERFADARRALATVLTVQPGNTQAQAYLGLTYEGLAHFDSARTVYTRLLETRAAQRDVRRLLFGRLQLLARKENQHNARLAIARESLLAATPPDPNTVAVMPFRYTGRDSTLRPLERGLAALVITDLSRVSRLRLVEREQLQALLDELQLAEGGRVDPATGARSGRLVRAGQVVQGQFQEVPTANFRMDASVVRASDAQVAATGSDADQLRALFDIEKRVVFQLLERMGITLTPAERTAISERPTRDVQAFLLYSRGLEAQDRGDFAAAAAAFQAAVQRDPSFQAAGQQAAAAEAASTAEAAPPTEVATAVGPEPAPSGGTTTTTSGTLATAINGTVPSGVPTIESVTTSTNTPPPTNTNPVCEGAGCSGPQNVALIGTIVIIIRRP
jgi:Tfp pilus assembly protein PilF